MGSMNWQILPPQVETPTDMAQKGLQLRHMAQQGQMEDMNLQQAKREQQDQELSRQSYMDSGGDLDKYQKLLMQRGGSAKLIQGAAAQKLEMQTKLAALTKDQLANQGTGHDQARASFTAFSQLPPDAQQAQWPQFLQQERSSNHLTNEDMQVIGQHYQQAPTPDGMKLLINGFSTGTQLADEEAKRRAAASADMTAQSKADEVKRQLANDAIHKPQWEADANSAVRKNDVPLLVAAAQQGQGAYNAALNNANAPHGTYPDASTLFNPITGKATPAAIIKLRELGMDATGQATTEQAAANAAQTARHQGVEEGQGAARLVVERANLGMRNAEYKQKFGDVLSGISPNNLAMAEKLASGDMNPALLGRMPGKEQIMAAAIQINPNWTSQTFSTKDAFTNPDKLQSKNLGTISRIVGHIGRFEQNSQQSGLALGYAAGVNVTGQQNKLNEDAHAISGELEKLVSGGVGAVEQTKAWQKSLHSPSSDARQQAIDEISQLIGSQYEGMNQTYKAGVGTNLPIEKFVTPAGQAWMKAKGINVQGAAPAAGGQAPPAASSGAALPKGNGRAADKGMIQKFYGANGNDVDKTRKALTDAGWTIPAGK